MGAASILHRANAVGESSPFLISCCTG